MESNTNLKREWKSEEIDCWYVTFVHSSHFSDAYQPSQMYTQVKDMHISVIWFELFFKEFFSGAEYLVTPPQHFAD